VTAARHFGAGRPKHLEWCHFVLLVPLGELGLVCFAHLKANDTLNRVTITGIYQKGLPYKLWLFTLLPEAQAWVAS
jgi:hypothetical protein